MHKLVYTLLAKKDLFDIFELIVNDKPSVAIEYLFKLEKYIELLETNPMMGTECKNKDINQNCRILIYGNYLIFYTIKNTDINIIRILNSRTDYKTGLKTSHFTTP